VHLETTFGTPSDLGTYVGFEIPGADVHVDGLEAHVGGREQALDSIQAAATTGRLRRRSPATRGHEMI